MWLIPHYYLYTNIFTQTTNYSILLVVYTRYIIYVVTADDTADDKAIFCVFFLAGARPLTYTRTIPYSNAYPPRKRKILADVKLYW